MARHRSVSPTPVVDRTPADRPDRGPVDLADRRSTDHPDRSAADRIASLRGPVAVRIGWVPDSDAGGVGAFGRRFPEPQPDSESESEPEPEPEPESEPEREYEPWSVAGPVASAADSEFRTDSLPETLFDPDPDPDRDPDDLGTGDDVVTDGGSDEPGSLPVRARRIRHGWSRFSETWVPEPLRDARVDPGRRGALLLSLIAALAAVAAAIGVWRDRPEPRPVQTIVAAPLTDTVDAPSELSPGSVALGGAGPRASPAPRMSSAVAGAEPGTTSTEPSVIAVSVTGQVRRPGLVRLAARSRVAEAIEAAGGASDSADLTGLNLATVLSDGDSVVVGGSSGPAGTVAGPAGPGGAVAPTSGPVAGSSVTAAPIDLNTADATTLETLPGVGPVMAANIISWRDQNGTFTSVEQLQEVTGIGPARFAQLSPLVTAG